MSETRGRILKVLNLIIDYRIKQKWNLQSIKGIVKSVNETDRTCVVTVDNFDYPGVWLQGINNLSTGFVQIPTVGSQVLMGRINDNYYIALFSKLDKVLFDVALVQFNGGSNGGMVKSSANVQNMTAIKTFCMNLMAAVATGLQAVGESSAASGSAGSSAFQSAMSGQVITFGNQENNSIKQ